MPRADERSAVELSEEAEESGELRERVNIFRFTLICVHEIPRGGERNHHHPKGQLQPAYLIHHGEKYHHQRIYENRQHESEAVFLVVFIVLPHELGHGELEYNVYCVERKVFPLCKSDEPGGDRRERPALQLFRREVKDHQRRRKKQV